MSNDFSDLLSARQGDIEAPKPLPVGNYNATILDWTTGRSSKKQTPFVEFALQVNGPTEDVNEQEFEEFGGMAVLADKALKVQYYLTDRAINMLAEVLRSLGLPQENSLEENLANTKGANVIALVNHEPGENGVFSRVRSIRGAE